MSKGTVNKVILIGRLGKDPDVRYMPSGDAIANISLATDSSWKDRNTGQMQEATEWHRVAFFGRLGEIAGQYLRKGSRAYIEGRIRTRKWQDQSGQDRYTTEIIADQLQLLDSKASSGGGGDSSSEYESTPRPSAPHRPAPAAARSPSNAGFNEPPPQDFDPSYDAATTRSPPQRAPVVSEEDYDQPAASVAPRKTRPASPNADEEFNDTIPF